MIQPPGEKFPGRMIAEMIPTPRTPSSAGGGTTHFHSVPNDASPVRLCKPAAPLPEEIRLPGLPAVCQDRRLVAAIEQLN